MPLKKDPQGGGTESNGTISATYCAYCYEFGEFKQPGWTVEQMRIFGISKLKEMKFPGFLARFFTRNLHKLERWQHP